MKVLIAVTHLLGTGHLGRALTLGRAFAARGHAVTVASGGFAAPHLDAAGLRLVQLPPLRSDGTDFARLLTPEGDSADAAYMARRQVALLACLTDHPDLVITELFPFGRRMLRGEFNALLEKCQHQTPPPRIVASVRDILSPPSKPARADWTAGLIARFYDAVLVHSDPQVIDLSSSWPITDQLAGKLRYTGFVAPPAAPPHPDRSGTGEVLVSAGGGAVGHHLFAIARASADLDAVRTWRLLVGGSDGEAHRAALRRKAPDNLRVDAVRSDFRSMLGHAACLVGLCGYNTALDVLQTGVPAVFVPFDAGGEVEQGLRATALARHPAVAVIRSADLTAAGLAATVDRLIAGGRRPDIGLKDDGAATSVAICEDLVGKDGA
ncbi:MAG: glycosyltransferase family protein [Marinibacterium sp.]